MHDDDWPDFDLVSAIKSDPARLRRWVGASPRRSLSPNGTELVVARRRRGGAIGELVMNMPPEGGFPGVETLDLAHAGIWSRVVLPVGVAVASVGAHDDGRVTLALVLDETISRALGLRPTFEITLQRAALTRLPEPWPAAQGSKMLDAFAALVAAALPGAPARMVARAEAFANAARAAEKQEARRHAERIARARRDAYRRSARVPLGDTETVLKEVAQKHGWVGDAWLAVRVFARPAVALIEDPGPISGVGRTRIGGAPDLPRGVAWPTVGGELLSFVLQVALEDVPPLGQPAVPDRGLLSLFIGRNDSTRDVEHLVLHVSAATADLVRSRPPRGASWRDEETGMLEALRVRAVRAVRLPPEGTAGFDALAAAWTGSGGESAVFALEKALRIPGPRDQTFIGGYHDPEVARRALGHARRRRDPPAHHRWELLFDVASHLSVRLNFWDAGRLAVVVPREDLEARSRRWDRTHAEIATS